MSRQQQIAQSRGEAAGSGACGAGTERLRAARAGWGELARAHGGAVKRCVRRALFRVGREPRPEEVEELVQEVYCRLLERDPARVAAGRDEAQLYSYLQRIASSVVVDQLRARHARKRGGWPTPGAPAPDRRDLAERPAPGPTAEERLLARERARAVRRRVRQAFPGPLGERNLLVLELAAIEGMTAIEIARRLDGQLSPSTVHTVLHRLRQLFAGPSEDGAAAAG
jgi:RNA polymerase sigma factor (sigma-70 family)